MPEPITAVLEQSTPEIFRLASSYWSPSTADSTRFRDLPHLKQHSQGLTDIADPPDATLNIVLIHGLMGSAYRTPDHEELGVYWPKDLVTHDFQYARIIVFGYVAVWHLWSQVSQEWLSGYAADLLGSLSECRSGNRVRQPPVTYSLDSGAVMNSHHDTTVYSHTAMATYGRTGSNGQTWIRLKSPFFVSS
ncbi:hypothetical protein BDV12DRAFT_202013 [Aspergillus spectabilis]